MIRHSVLPALAVVLIEPGLAAGGANSLAQAQERQLAFPGAEGYGKYTVGGRGGAVIEVTNLNDSGPGSLRAAVEARGPRTVVFRVSGAIDLRSSLVIRNPNITIAGQTAPGGGIQIKSYPLVISTDEVILRHVRIRLGGDSGVDADAVSGRYHKNLIIDHASASWSVDEVLSIYHMENVTVQWSIISESLYGSNHEKGHHGFGGIWGSNYSSYHHNLIAHNSSRNPRFASGSGNTDFRNNAIYNWGYESAYGGEARQVGSDAFTFSNINVVGNYYKPGPATQPGRVSHRIVAPWTRDGSNDLGRWFVADNVVEGNAAVTADNWNGGVQLPEGVTDPTSLRLAQPWPSMAIDQQTPLEAFHLILAGAGATKPARDSIDRRIVREARDGTATFEGASYRREQTIASTERPIGMIDDPRDVGGWPELASAPAPADSDHDGMADDWERANGLDPANAADRNRIGPQGYTMLEAYLNSL